MTELRQNSSPIGIWLHKSLLPDVPAHCHVSLGEGFTPLIALHHLSEGHLNRAHVWGKAEYLNPTGSYKDRIAAAAVSLALHRDKRFILGTSSGNGGAAVSAYAARAGLPTVLLTSPTAVSGKLEQIAAVGGEVIRVDELGSGARALDELIPTVLELCQRHEGEPFLAGFHYMPEAMQGVTTIWTEIEEQMRGPDVIYAPVGGGGLVTGLHQGMVASGSSARVVGVQPRGCDTLARALEGKPGRIDRITTEVSGLQVGRLFDEEGARAAIQQTGGRVVLVSDEEILAAQLLLARTEGILVEPAGAAALAGVMSDAREGRVTEEDAIALVLTGAAHKDRKSLTRLAGDLDRRSSTQEVASLVSSLMKLG